MNDIERLTFRRQLETLAQVSGHGTTLVSFYVPPSRPISDAVGRISAELSTAGNIKSKQTRDAVETGLKMILSRLKQHRAPPKNGMVLFAGLDEITVLEPPAPINSFLYRCDDRYLLDPLFEMVRPQETIGLVVIDQKECTIGVLRGKSVTKLWHGESNVPRKTHMGGASQARYGRLHEQAIVEFFKRCGEHVDETLIDVSRMLIGGPGYTKVRFATEHYLKYDVQAKVHGEYVDVGNTDETGLSEMIQFAGTMLSSAALEDERRIVIKFLTLVGAGGPASYGKTGVAESLTEHRVETLLLSENLPLEIIKQYETLVSSTGATLRLISTDTSEGKQLWRGFGGYGAILRY